MWREERAMFANRRIFGRKGDDNREIEASWSREAILLDKSMIWQWYDDTGKLVVSSWRENKRRVFAQLSKLRYKRTKDPVMYELPEKLKPNEKKITDAILNTENVKLTTGLVRYKNGRPMDTEGIAKLSGISNIRTAQRALKGLIEKGVLILEKVGVYKLNKLRYVLEA